MGHTLKTIKPALAAKRSSQGIHFVLKEAEPAIAINAGGSIVGRSSGNTERESSMAERRGKD
jgi:hypothetical protein